MADPGQPGADVVKRVGEVIAAIAGFIALMYAAGGGVLALRLYLADLPSRTVVGQLPRDLLISVGLAQIVLPMGAFAAFYGGWRLLRGAARPPRRLVSQWRKPPSKGWPPLFAAAAVPALLATGAMALGADRVRLGWSLLWLLPLTFLLTLLVVLVALNVRARLAGRYSDPPSLWNTRGPLLSMTLVVAFASLPACVIFAGTINLLDTRVCTKTQPVDGVLIGETGDRTYVGQTKRPKGPLLVFSIPESQITQTFIGGEAELRPCPASQPAA